jgi:pilus assembly protein Flp/PilA
VIRLEKGIACNSFDAVVVHSEAIVNSPGGRTMMNFAKKVQRFLASEDGPTAVEYAVMLALIVIVCLSAISAIGTNTNLTFQEVADSIAP